LAGCLLVAAWMACGGVEVVTPVNPAPTAAHPYPCFSGAAADGGDPIAEQPAPAEEEAVPPAPAEVETPPAAQPSGQAAAVEDVGVDHGGFNVLVAEQFLDGADIILFGSGICGERI